MRFTRTFVMAGIFGFLLATGRRFKLENQWGQELRNVNRRFRKLAVLIVALVSAAPVDAACAHEFGVTPSHVFGVWTNVNNALVNVSQVVSDDPVWLGEFTRMPIGKFEGKRPADVLQLVLPLYDKLDRLRRGSGLRPTERAREHRGEITPNEVYLNSGRILNGLVDWLVRNTDDDLLISQFYIRHDFHEKRPSDVFALVELANRRLDEILERSAEPGPGNDRRSPGISTRPAQGPKT